jgi:YbbR domain-containing protein
MKQIDLWKAKKNKIKYLFSITSSTVADPSTVTVRIESASTSDLNVQDVVTTSSSDNDDDDLQQNNPDRHNSSITNRRHTSALGTNNNYLYQQRPSRLSTDATNSMRPSQLRPITAVSLPAKP